MACIDAETSKAWAESDAMNKRMEDYHQSKLLKENRMPCYDGRTSSDELKETVDSKNIIIAEKDAMLCAILSTLETLGLAESTIKMAEKNGQVKIKPFWLSHQQQDVDRLSSKLKKDYSEDELHVLARILKEGGYDR